MLELAARILVDIEDAHGAVFRIDGSVVAAVHERVHRLKHNLAQVELRVTLELVQQLPRRNRSANTLPLVRAARAVTTPRHAGENGLDTRCIENAFDLRLGAAAIVVRRLAR